MKTIGQIIFWTVGALLVVPAIVGVLAGVAAIALITLVGLIAVIVALAILCLSCVPIIWWCGMWESINTQQWLTNIRKTLKKPANEQAN